MKLYYDYKIHKKIFLGNLIYKKYFNNIFELYYEEGIYLSLTLHNNDYNLTSDEIDNIFTSNDYLYNNNYMYIKDKFKNTFIYYNNDRYEYNNWLNNLINQEDL